MEITEELQRLQGELGTRPRLILYLPPRIYGEGDAGADTSKSMAWVSARLKSHAEITAICLEGEDTELGLPILSMAELSGQGSASYDFIVMVTDREGIAVLGQQRLEMAGVPYEKIRWLKLEKSVRKEICIMVSMRLDVNSVSVPNPLYLPVRCGAYRDKKKHSIWKGDNMGENISRYQAYFSEFTVQYWGWKNILADYYGLCHYRRYLSFAEQRFPVNERAFIKEPCLDKGAMEQYGLLDVEHMRHVIEGADAVLNIPADVRKISINGKHYGSVRKLWDAHQKIYFPKGSMDLLMKTITVYEPSYLPYAQEYMAGIWHRGYNCYVLRKELFEELCRMQEHILRPLFSDFLQKGYLIRYPRSCGYLGEVLYGIFCHKLCQDGQYRINERQLLEIDNTTLLQYREGGSAL